jgi:hypothetical protein
MYKYIAGIWFGVFMVVSLSGIVLPLLISTDRIPVYVIILITSGIAFAISCGVWWGINRFSNCVEGEENETRS